MYETYIEYLDCNELLRTTDSLYMAKKICNNFNNERDRFIMWYKKIKK